MVEVSVDYLMQLDRVQVADISTATYVGDKADGAKDAPPDPGAMAAAIFLRGLLDGLGK